MLLLLPLPVELIVDSFFLPAVPFVSILSRVGKEKDIYSSAA
jgi:hypothetical protein